MTSSVALLIIVGRPFLKPVWIPFNTLLKDIKSV